MQRNSHAQRGAAMVEFIVGAVFVLVPMLLAVQALGKFADVQHTANAAARYAAWEKTVWFDETSSLFHQHNRPNQKSDAEIRNEWRVRILNDRRSAARFAASDKTDTTLKNGLDPLWHDTEGVPFADDPAKMAQASTRERPANDGLGAVLGLLSGIPVPEMLVGTLAPPVPADTLAATTVTFGDVSAKSEVYKRLWSKAAGLPQDWTGLSFEGRSGVLSNTWAANASSGTRDMVAESVPTAKALGTAVEAGALVTMGLWDPTLAPRLDMGKIAPDVLPDDRLK